ncbi:hypothetical protein D3C81_2068990 [compost metagenome]
MGNPRTADRAIGGFGADSQHIGISRGEGDGAAAGEASQGAALLQQAAGAPEASSRRRRKKYFDGLGQKQPGDPQYDCAGQPL